MFWLKKKSWLNKRVERGKCFLQRRSWALLKPLTPCAGSRKWVHPGNKILMLFFSSKERQTLKTCWWSSYKTSPSGFQTTTSQGLKPSPGVEEITNYYVWYVCECKCVYERTYLWIRTVFEMAFSPPCRSSPLLLCCVLHDLPTEVLFPSHWAISPATFCHAFSWLHPSHLFDYVII